VYPAGYSFSYIKGVLRRVTLVNLTGNPCTDGTDFCMVVTRYRATLTLSNFLSAKLGKVEVRTQWQALTET